MNNQLQLLQSYYRFLSLGKYLEFLIQSKDFSKEVLDIAIVTGKRSHFGIKSSMIKALLKQIHEKPDQRNIFWYLVEISSFRGIFGIMRELLENDEKFKKFVVSRLYEHYFDFEQIIRLIRNILSHTTTADLIIKNDAFVKQRDFLVYAKNPVVSFKFSYANYWKEWKGNKEYGLDITIAFTNLKEGDSLFDIISLHQLYILSELCYNLCEVFRAENPVKKPTKSIWKKIYKKYSQKQSIKK